MPSAWPLFTTLGPLTKAEVLLDTTCFSTTDFDNLPDTEDSPLAFDLAKPTNMPFNNPELFTEIFRRRDLSNSSLDVHARYNHPTFPAATFLTTLIQQERFSEYISTEFPSFNNNLRQSTTNHEPLCKEVNAPLQTPSLTPPFPLLLVQLSGYSGWFSPTTSSQYHSKMNTSIMFKNVGTNQDRNFRIFRRTWWSMPSRTGSTT